MVTTESTVMAAGAIDLDTILDLRARIAGEVLTPGDAGYDDARTLWNGMIDKYPAVIAQPGGVSDVMQVVRFAQDYGLPLSIKGGGHNVAGHALVDGGLTIDMASMNTVHVDPVRRVARVEAGATWADFDRETAVFGLATTGGVVSSTGVAGLTLGGGIGWLVGKYGMSIDNLLSVDIVTAGGEFLRASTDENPDLFWALRGGGGNFGVVTSFEFRLHPISEVLAGYIMWPVEDAAEVLTFYREFTENSPEEMTAYFQLGTDPESGMRLVMIVFFYPEVNDTAHQLVEQIRAFKTPLMDTVGPISYQEWQMAADPELPPGFRYYWKGVLLDSLTDGVMDATLQYVVDTERPGFAVALEHYRGAMNRVAPDATAFANRDVHYQLLIIGGWEDPDDDELGITWVRSFNAALAPHSIQAAFLNFNSTDVDEKEKVVRAGFRQNYARMAEIKRRYDPDNVFAANNNIRPASE